MPSWFSKNLGDALLVDGLLSQLETLFVEEHTKVGNPVEMALFSRHESEGRLHCELIVYFSPASSTVANQMNAKPCVKPSACGLGLLAGTEESRLVLFPDADC